MLVVNIPGYANLQIEHLLLDFNGTIAFDGRIIDGVREALIALALLLHPKRLTATLRA